MSQDQKTQDLHENVGFICSDGKRKLLKSNRAGGESGGAKPAEGFCLSGRIPQVSHPVIIIIRSV